MFRRFFYLGGETRALGILFFIFLSILGTSACKRVVSGRNSPQLNPAVLAISRRPLADGTPSDSVAGYDEPIAGRRNISVHFMGAVSLLCDDFGPMRVETNAISYGTCSGNGLYRA
jgi:hypothetical protein